MIGEPVIVAADRRQAVGIDHRPADAAVAAFPAPAQRARGVAGRRHGGQTRFAEPHVAAVGDHPADAAAGKGLCMPACGSSALAAPVLSTFCRRRRCHQRRAGQLLQPRDAADMVEMLMAVSRYLMSVSRKPSCRILSAIRSAPFSVPASIRTWPSLAGDQDRGDAAGADQIGVAVDADRRRRLVPVGPNRRKLPPIAGPHSSIGARRPLDLARRLAERDGDLAAAAWPAATANAALANIAGAVDVDHRSGRGGRRVDRQPADRFGDLVGAGRPGRAGCRRRSARRRVRPDIPRSSPTR